MEKLPGLSGRGKCFKADCNQTGIGSLQRVVPARDCSEGSIFRDGIQMTFEGGVSARTLVIRLVWLF